MADVEVLLPKMGESVAEATITTWLKEVGDTIEEDEAIVEIATDKVDSEVPAPTSGVLKQKLFNEGIIDSYKADKLKWYKKSNIIPFRNIDISNYYIGKFFYRI